MPPAVSPSPDTLGLVLSRRRDERVVIGDYEIVVTVVSIWGDKVRLAFKAPPEVKVHRAEVLERIEREQTRKTEIQAARAAERARVRTVDSTQEGTAAR